MELKRGYRNTEVGVIPEDWKVSRLDKIAKITRGRFSPRPRNNPIYYGGLIPFVQTGDVTKCGGTITEYSQTLNELGLEVSILFKKGTILMTIAANIGYTGILRIDMACPDSLVAIDGFTGMNNSFLNYWFIYRRSKIEELSTSGAQKNLSIELLSPFKVSIPSIKEQTAIATALSDADALITSLEKIIAKKRNIKQGAMQQLLKPKKGWEVKRLGEIVDVLDNLRRPLNDIERQKMKGDIPYCGANGIVGFVNDYLINDDVILMAEDGGYFDEYKTRPIAYKMKGKCWVNNHAHILKAKVDVSQDFIYYSLVNKNILDFINGGTRAKLNKGELINIPINIPKSKDEQNAIITILSDMDDEILSLEDKLEKYRQIKSGMMQNLLTGKIRLV